ncbi:MAG TPA: hypothetical protein VKS20_08180 [Candidatus Acidoferrales bacterium]|nr:hypothetical protein [Candidatus Acidoferrales bacterium]
MTQAAQDGSRKKIKNAFRKYLCDNWFYLKQAIQEGVRAYTHPDQVPFLITAKFKENIAKPRTGVDELLAAHGALKI